ncbi:MAG: hypothetical protein AAB870_01185 [Patescibacteria group bacterium]|mgnify:CR=1 FL=1
MNSVEKKVPVEILKVALVEDSIQAVIGIAKIFHNWDNTQLRIYSSQKVLNREQGYGLREMCVSLDLLPGTVSELPNSLFENHIVLLDHELSQEYTGKVIADIFEKRSSENCKIIGISSFPRNYCIDQYWGVKDNLFYGKDIEAIRLFISLINKHID